MKGKQKERTLTVNTVKTFAQTLQDDGAVQGAGRDRRHRHQARGLLRQQELGRGALRGAARVRHGDGRRRGASSASTASSSASSPRRRAARWPASSSSSTTTATPARTLRIDCTRFGSGAYSHPDLGRAPRLRDRRRSSSSASRPPACSSAWSSTTTGRTRDCILVSMGGVPTRACRRFIRRLADEHEAAGLRLRRRRPLRLHQHLPHAQGRLGQRRPPQRVLLRAAGALPGRHAAGHHRLQAAHAPAEGRRHQARARTP